MSHVLRLRRTDQPDNFVLLHSQQNGPAVLDLRLVGTDGENPFVAEIKHSKVQKFRSSQYQGTQEEWISILSALLLRHQAAADVTQGLEAVASVAADAITVSFRKNISGITVGRVCLLLSNRTKHSIAATSRRRFSTSQ